MVRMRALSIAGAMVVACGGVTRVDSSVDGGGHEPSMTGGASGTGGAGAGAGHQSAGGAGGHAPPLTGGAGSAGGTPPVVPDCESPAPAGTPCAASSLRCAGPCSNSWRVEIVCKKGTWEFDRVVTCGPNASTAPQCANSFSSGELTPCCTEGGLDCTGKPDGYPGFGCTPGAGSFCSCTCYGGVSRCGC
ncbi:MAG TPA: hypothetical protein VH062_26275 [Polyangiaceae bacterium]|jgi:hypothetical protein|nr:hypothetical protein [Polyangiaceae bacterium]